MHSLAGGGPIRWLPLSLSTMASEKPFMRCGRALLRMANKHACKKSSIFDTKTGKAMTQRDSTSETFPPKAPPTWLTPGVRGIGLASFLADMGHEVPTALFASLVVSVLGASAAVLGLIEGLADGLAGLARLLGDPLADDP